MDKTAETLYTYGAGLTSETKAEGTYYYHFNNIGSTTEITDAAGAVKYRITYGPYGELTGIKDGNQNVINIADEAITPFLYNGQMGVQTDQNGLYYMRARYYNTDIKRFINRDTVSGDLTNSQSLNRYSYVQGNPVSLTDPFGLSPMGGDVMSILPQLIHTGLAIGGFFWDGFDLINAAYYAIEGNPLMAASCAVAAIPFLGSVVAKGVSKYALKTLKYAEKASDFAQAAKAAKAFKAAGYIKDVSKLVGYTGMTVLGAMNTVQAYKEYDAAKANGTATFSDGLNVAVSALFTVVTGVCAVSAATKVTARLKADGVGAKVKASAEKLMSGNNKGASASKVDDLLNSDYYKRDFGYDCSEIAQDFYDAAGQEGKIYRIEGKNGYINGYEYKYQVEYTYHEVYSDGVHIYDPRYVNTPVLKDDYFRALREINPDGFDVFTIK